MLKTRDSKRDERMPGWPINGVPVKRQVGMIYWYSWGKQEFDIRTMRRVLGLPEEQAADNWFMAAKPDACGSFHAVMEQLQAALGEKSFHDAMVEHDSILDEEAEAFLSANKARQQQAASGSAADVSAAFEDAPF